MNNKANKTSFKPGNRGGGRPAKTDDERAGEKYLRERTLAAAQVLVDLQGPENEPKIRLGAATTHLKITLGDLNRLADPAGEKLDTTPPLTNEERRAYLKLRLAEEKAT